MSETSPRPQFEHIQRKTIAEEVRAAIFESIRSGELAPGTQLPPERGLCEQFGVARTTIREAVQGLVSLGLVVRSGNRFYVVEHLPSVRFGGDDLRKRKVSELFEVRHLVEVRMAELAACRASDVERSEILAVASGFHEGLPLDEFRRLDRRLHTLVSSACGNPTLVELYRKVVLDVLFESGVFDSLLKDPRNRRIVQKIITDSVIEHKAIAEAVAEGDAPAAAAAADHHLKAVEANMISRMV